MSNKVIVNNKEYSGLRLNMNSRAITVDEDKYQEVLDTINLYILQGDSNQTQYYNLIKQSLNYQYNDYTKYKDLPKANLGRKRKEEIGELLRDKYSLLISTGCVPIGYNYGYTLDLSNCLDIAIAVTFNEDLSTVRAKLHNLCDAHDISLPYLSQLLLSHDMPWDNFPEIDLEFAELCEISPGLTAFLCELITYRDLNDVSPLDLLGTSYSKVIAVGEDDALATALLLKLAIGLNNVIKWFAIQVSHKESNALLFSQFIAGLTFYIDHPLSSEYIYPINSDGIKLPIRPIGVVNGSDLRW